MDDALYMRLAEEFTARLHREEYSHLAGLKDTFDTESLFEEFHELFTRDAVLQRLDHRDDRVGRHLAEFAVYRYIGRRLSGLTERIANRQNAARVRVGGKALPFRQAWGMLTRVSDLETRRRIERQVAAAIDRQNADRAQRILGQREIARELGFADYCDLSAQLSGQDLHTLRDEITHLVTETDSACRRRLARALQSDGIDPEGATDADLRWVLLAPRFTDLFAHTKLLPAAEATLSGLGLSLRCAGRVRFDLEQRPKKYPRAFCSPISVPGEVHICAAPQGGWLDFLAFFHEVGHAQHFAHTDPDLPCPCRIMGDDAVAEAFACLFQSIVSEEDWLRRTLGAECIPAAFFERARILQSWHIRRYAGKITYEIELHGGGSKVADMAPRYAHLLGAAVGVRVAPEHFLFDVDDCFYSARYLRGWVFEACLHAHLRDHFGPSWYRSPEAGELLRSLWRRGKELTAEELANEFGIDYGLRPLRQTLRSP